MSRHESTCEVSQSERAGRLESNRTRSQVPAGSGGVDGAAWVATKGSPQQLHIGAPDRPPRVRALRSLCQPPFTLSPTSPRQLRKRTINRAQAPAP